MNQLAELAGHKVLVTGAAGCIGAWVVKGLLEVDAVPVVFDVSDNRARLDFIMPDVSALTWEVGDIRDFQQLNATVSRHEVSAIIHLAALQVPFCKADPVTSTAINVMGTTHILECARQAGIKRLAYASSVAAPAMEEGQWLSTLYGAHKVCGEQMAAVYWQDWQVPSVGIRPPIIYGPGRDQGMSAAPTIAMLSAHCGQPYCVPFQGNVSFVHAEDAATRFITAVAGERKGASVFDLNGTRAEVAEVIEIIREYLPGARIDQSGDPLPFPACADDGKLDDYLGIEACRPFRAGVADTLDCFNEAAARGINLNALLDYTLGKTA